MTNWAGSPQAQNMPRRSRVVFGAYDQLVVGPLHNYPLAQDWLLSVNTDTHKVTAAKFAWSSGALTGEQTPTDLPPGLRRVVWVVLHGDVALAVLAAVEAHDTDSQAQVRDTIVSLAREYLANEGHNLLESTP